MAIFVWGVGINELRIVIITLLAPIVSQNLFQSHMEILDPKRRYEDEHQENTLEKDKKPIVQRANALSRHHNDWCARAGITTCFLVAPESIDIALDALYTIAIKNDTVEKFKVKDDEIKAFDEAKLVRNLIRKEENKHKKKAAHEETEKKSTNDANYSAAYHTETKLVGASNVAIELANVNGGKADMDSKDLSALETGAKPTTVKKKKNKKGGDKDGKKKKNKKSKKTKNLGGDV